MPTTSANGLELYFETFGSPTDPTVLMVSGLGAQCVAFDEELCESIAALGRHVVRYDHRDVGLSTHLHDSDANPLAAFAALGAGTPIDAPYTLSDMAADGVALLDSLGIERADLFGTSMGGMIAQTMAIEHPGRVRSLTSVMSTTGEPEFGAPAAETLGALLQVLTPAEDRAARIANAVLMARVIGTPSVFDEARAVARATTFVDRAYDPAGSGRQFVAIMASGSRAEGLARLSLPTVVLHGDEDPLVHISGGQRTAELVPDAEFRLLERMGHDLPPEYWARVVAGLADNLARAAD